ncbi:hypothetical protein TNCV_3661921 [Trichonephila clavipes]|nr:hypothetical protein TNCV_3661921 [Trichonephila clavipes]
MRKLSGHGLELMAGVVETQAQNLVSLKTSRVERLTHTKFDKAHCRAVEVRREGAARSGATKLRGSSSKALVGLQNVT